ncbi:MAG: hypothetical protein MOIL_00589 [Candidatus Methanolliviera sp. GoM_oil]|nr:MAG: hypothetical protein MOIL_00589 [Candidatus Methanolliviera sp. GoM_oil]
MLSKEELRDGPFTLIVIPKEEIKKSTMSPLDYCSLSGLSSSKTIKIGQLYKLADITRETIAPKEGESYEVINLADIDKTIGEITKIKIINGGEITNQKAKFFYTDIIFGKIRPYLNNVAVVDEKPTKQNFFIGSSEWVRIKSKNYSYYLLLALRSKFTLFQTSARIGSVRPRFDPDKLPFIEIPIIRNKKLLSFVNSIVKQIFDIRTFCNGEIKCLIEEYDKLLGVKTKKEKLIVKISQNKINKKRMDANYYILTEIKEEIKKKKYKELKDLVNFSGKKVYEEYKDGDTFEYITTSDADSNQGEIVYWEEKVYNPQSPVSNKAPGRAQMLLKENQILIPYLKLSVESVAWIPKDLEDYISSNGFAVLEPKDGDYGFLYLALRSTTVQDQLKLIAAGTIMEDISKDDLKEIFIFIPNDDIKKYLSWRMAEILGIRWQARKTYIQMMSFYEDFCSHFLDIEKFEENLKQLSQELNKLNFKNQK